MGVCMDIIDEGSSFQINGIMHENDGVGNLREDGCMITRCILEVERLS